MIYQLGNMRPQLHESAWVAPSADLIGNVVLQSEASVWFRAVLRGDDDLIEVGEGSNIQDGTVCHVDAGFPLRIGRHVTVGHKAMLHGCTIGNGVLIGMGATVLNGAVIGEGALIGAGALVTEGKKIPAGALVMGIPGKIIRQQTLGEIEEFQKGATRYVARAKVCQKDLILKQ